MSRRWPHLERCVHSQAASQPAKSRDRLICSLHLHLKLFLVERKKESTPPPQWIGLCLFAITQFPLSSSLFPFLFRVLLLFSFRLQLLSLFRLTLCFFHFFVQVLQLLQSLCRHLDLQFLELILFILQFRNEQRSCSSHSLFFLCN